MQFTRAIPTNLITGFLGAGKTTLIKRLLEQKPADEQWAVLINEFGEVGIDESLLGPQQSVGSGLVVRQVPGGCLCCSAGLTLQVALHDIIRHTRPDRLIIEPTGLGHPRQLLQTLCGPTYQGVLAMGSTLTLLDARQLSSARHISHPVFNEQLAVADVIVAHKSDTYQDEDRARLEEYLITRKWQDKTLHFCQYGDLPFTLLQSPSGFKFSKDPIGRVESRPSDTIWQAQIPDFPDSGVIRRENQGEGYYSLGWMTHPALMFEPNRLKTWLDSLEFERIKGVFITQTGIFGYNRSGIDAHWFALDEISCSRLEIIDIQPLAADELHQELASLFVAG